jgi:PhnB protein
MTAQTPPAGGTQTPPAGGTQTQPVGGSEGTGLGTRADGIGHAAPAGYSTVTPWVISSDTGRLIEFVQEAFGAHELARVPGPDGRVGHAEMRIGDAVVMMFDRADDWPDTPGFLRLYVEDADLVYERALAAGATPVTPVTGLFFGDRVGRVRDPLGNIWWIQAHVEDVDPAELARRPSDPGAMAALRFVETSLDVAMRPN